MADRVAVTNSADQPSPRPSVADKLSHMITSVSLPYTPLTLSRIAHIDTAIAHFTASTIFHFIVSLFVFLQIPQAARLPSYLRHHGLA